MTYLVDANVLCEPTKPMPNEKVVEWLRANERDLVVDPVVLGELCIGVLSLFCGTQARTTRTMVRGGGADHRLRSLGRRCQPP